ncbi:MAG: glycoside hydrolase family 3 protein [Ruminococcaceae bacterium]|nr:glycoside hydrolase family 3 protein [Oscillospiraceae bacterium]
MPEKEKQASRKKRSKTTPLQKIAVVLFTLVVCVVTYIVYKAMNSGMGLPVNNFGTIISEKTTATQPTQTQLVDPTQPPQTTQPTETTRNFSDEEIAMLYMNDMTLEEKIWQLMLVRPAAANSPDGVQRPVGGVYYAPEDLTDGAQLPEQLEQMRTSYEIPVLLGVSEEGGSVAPLSALGLTDPLEPMATYGEAGDEQAVYDFSLKLGQKLSELGFHFNLAPVADTVNWYPEDVGDRSFSTDVDVAAKMVSQSVKAMGEGGTIACLKHFPNLGSSATDGTNDISWRPYANFRETDFVPFRAGIEAGAQMVLVSNMMAPDMTNGVYMPCCMSENIVNNILRSELGFKGVVISDDQSGRTDAEAFVSIIRAGCDMILMPADAQAAFDAIIAAVRDGSLSEERINESVYRILLMKCGANIIVE